MRPQNIELHIEELVLHGFAAKDRYAIGAAVQRELQRLFAEQGVPQPLQPLQPPGQGCELVGLDGGAFTLKPGAPAHTIGVQVARSVYGGLGIDPPGGVSGRKE
jgi:hypothetical protein